MATFPSAPSTSHPPHISKASVAVISLSGGLGIAAIVMARLSILAVVPTALYASGVAFLVSSAVTGVLLYKKYSKEISSNPVTPSSSNHPSPRSVTNKPYAERIREAYKKKENLQSLIAEAMKSDADLNSLTALKVMIRQSLTEGRTDVARMISQTPFVWEFFELAEREGQIQWAEALMIDGRDRLYDWNDTFCKLMDVGKIDYAKLILSRRGISLETEDLHRVYGLVNEASSRDKSLNNIFDVITGKLKPIVAFRLACDHNQLAWAQQIANNVEKSTKLDQEWRDLYTNLKDNKKPYAQLILNIKQDQDQNKVIPPFCRAMDGRKINSAREFLLRRGMDLSEADLSKAYVLAKQVNGQGELSNILDIITGRLNPITSFKLAYDNNQLAWAKQIVKNIPSSSDIALTNPEWNRLLQESTNTRNFARKHQYADLILDIPNDVELSPDVLANAFQIAFQQGIYGLAQKIIGRTPKNYVAAEDNELQVALTSVIAVLLAKQTNPTSEQITSWANVVKTLLDRSWSSLALQIYNTYRARFVERHEELFAKVILPLEFTNPEVAPVISAK